MTAAEMLKRFPNTMTFQFDDGTKRSEFDIARRMADLDSSAVKTVSWDSVKAKLLGQLDEL